MQPPAKKNRSLKVDKKKEKESSKITSEEMSKVEGHSPNNSGDSGSDSGSVSYYPKMRADINMVLYSYMKATNCL